MAHKARLFQFGSDIGDTADGVLLAQLLGDDRAVDREGGPGQRTRTERQNVRTIEAILEAAAVALEHVVVGEQVVPEQNRLRALQMRVARHDRCDMRLRLRHQRGLQIVDRRQRRCDRILQEKPNVRDDLIVAAARCVQSRADRADLFGQAPLDRHVDVFVADRRDERPLVEFFLDITQPAHDPVAVLRADDSGRREHPRMRDARTDVVRIQADVEADRGGEAQRVGGGRFLEAAAPAAIGRLPVVSSAVSRPGVGWLFSGRHGCCSGSLLRRRPLRKQRPYFQPQRVQADEAGRIALRVD